jgi:two-component system, NtrC family, response regulator GlrR
MNEQSSMILLIDDDEELSEILCLSLESSGFAVRHCTNSADALILIRTHSFSLVLLDLRLGEENGLDLLPKLRDHDSEVPIFILTAHGDVNSAVEAFTLGGNGYIQKPFQEGQLKYRITQAIDNYQMRKQLRAPQSAATGATDVRSIVRSVDPLMEPLLQRIEIAAQVTSNVLISGDSGTGKELVARALHECGPRRMAPFIAFNCAALPESLLESELFGYMKGAFTDARETRPGLFARANGGTLFLDEIGDAPMSIQVKLLRVLQEKEVMPLGSMSSIKIDVRVVAATHKSLQEEITQGHFRQDLFYRLHVIPFHIPPLRNHPRDILFLANMFAMQLAEEMKLPFDGFTKLAEEALDAHPWPGNIRELQNRVEHALVIGNGGTVSAKRLFPEREFNTADVIVPVLVPVLAPILPRQTEEAVPTFIEAKTSFERSYLERLLSAARGNITKASRLASKSRTEVYGLLRKHGLDPSLFKNSRKDDAS